LFPGEGTSLSQLWRGKQLEYTWLRSLMGRYADFSAITRAALTTACNMLRLELNEAEARRLMDAYLVLKAFPDVMDTLTRLHGRKLAILSNGSPAMLNAVVRHTRLDQLLDAVLSVDALRIFKPHPSVYAYAAERLQAPAGAIGFVSSNFWDVAGATSFGFRTFWVNRAGTAPDDLGFQPAAVLSRLTDLPALLK
jgi:2-haloacid dehalogenase